MKNFRSHKLIAVIASALALIVGAGVDSPATSPVANQSPAAYSESQQNPMTWGSVIRIVTTKTACENLRRVMPNPSGLKCVKAG
ncbi:hypothetical protein ACN08Z_05460 [Rothia sp. P7181]|uniref:hypothetical protein n=1 Tax=Rothia sp. P7181 TaxID=3402663 RepID=UPI003ADCE5B4